MSWFTKLWRSIFGPPSVPPVKPPFYIEVPPIKGEPKPVEVKPPPVDKPPQKPIDAISGTILDKHGKLIINRKVLAVTKHFESLVLVAEDDGYGTPTVGFGRIVYEDGRKVRLGDRCTPEQAEAWLLIDLYDKAAKYVRAYLHDDVENAMSDDEFSVWTDLTFNRGSGRFGRSMAPFLNKRDRAGALRALVGEEFTTAGGRYSLGLDRRRWCERFILEGKDHTQFFSLARFQAFQKTDEYKRGRA